MPKAKKIMPIVNAIAGGIVKGVLIVYFFVACIMLYNGAQTGKTLNHQNDVIDAISTTFLNYEDVASKYIKQPNSHNKAGLMRASHRLDAHLNTVVQVYGLGVKKWTDLFRVWQFQFERRLLAKDFPKGDSERWMSSLMTYQLVIADKSSAIQQGYKNAVLNKLLYPYVSIGLLQTRHPNKKAFEKINTIYQTKAKALIPATMKQFIESPGFVKCMGPSSLDPNSPQDVADNIVFLQYLSRACSHPGYDGMGSLCKRSQETFRFSADNDEDLNNMLAVCKIAEQRLHQEVTTAQEKYGELSYAQYFEKFVEPLIPQHQQALKNAGAAYKACNPDQLPVVSFRDPNIDARIAAYEMYGYRYCHTYFDNDNSQFGQYQQMRWLLSKRS